MKTSSRLLVSLRPPVEDVSVFGARAREVGEAGRSVRLISSLFSSPVFRMLLSDVISGSKASSNDRWFSEKQSEITNFASSIERCVHIRSDLIAGSDKELRGRHYSTLLPPVEDVVLRGSGSSSSNMVPFLISGADRQLYW